VSFTEERIEESRRWYAHILTDELRRAGNDEKARARAYAKYAARIALTKEPA
jgi:hypothetical protein